MSNNSGFPTKQSNVVCIISLICGIVAFIYNPLYLVSIGALITGIIGLTGYRDSKILAVIGLILGIAAFLFQFVTDLLLSVFTMGLSFFF